MRRLALASLLVLAGGAVQAADNGVYLGAGISQSTIDDALGSSTGLDIESTAWKIIAGFRPLDMFAVEASYTDLGDESASFGLGSASAEATAIAGYAMIFLPVPFIDLYAKAGLAQWQIEGRGDLGGSVFSIDEDGTEFAYGLGGQLRFGSLAARLEYERFDIDNTDGLDLYTLGVTWTFL